jgi:hypothetical protein
LPICTGEGPGKVAERELRGHLHRICTASLEFLVIAERENENLRSEIWSDIVAIVETENCLDFGPGIEAYWVI